MAKRKESQKDKSERGRQMEERYRGSEKGIWVERKDEENLEHEVEKKSE